MPSRLAIGLDLGGTTVTGLLVREDGGIPARRRRPTPPAAGSTRVLETMRDMASELRVEAGSPVVGLGLGFPGPIDTERGVCLLSPNLGWVDLDVASFFRQALGLPVRLDNDVRVATLGEAWLGAGRPFRTFICLTVGTGIGAGVVLDGRLWRGPGFSAGEIGHLPVAPGPEAPLCGCGRRGCLETLASGKAIAREARLAIARGEPTVLAGEPTAREVAEAARHGDATARRLYEQAALHLAAGVTTVVDLFNPEAVIIGGGVAEAWDLLFPVLDRAVRELTFPPNLTTLKAILKAELGEDAGAVGAASLFLAPRNGETVREEDS